MKSIDALIERFVRQDIQSTKAYAIQASHGLIKLDAMENPFSLDPDLQQELGQRLGRAAINRYPAQRVQDLIEALSRHVDLAADQALMLGNGSDELISLVAMACAVPGASILAPEPGFVMYGISAQQQRIAYKGVPLSENFDLDTAAMLEAIRIHAPAIVYLAYPNNPTANLWEPEAMRSVIAQAPGLVVVDEAYQPFSSHSWIEEMRRHPEQNQNVLLLRTLSKFGLAGARIGYLLGPKALVQQIDKLRPPYNISVLNAECALFALEHAEVYAQQAQEIRRLRELLLTSFRAMPGVQVYPSQANMILIRVANADQSFQQLKGRGVLVKNVSSMHPLLRNCLRVTVGAAMENESLLQAMKETN